MFDTARLKVELQSAGPALLLGLRLWASVCLALHIAFWLELDDPSWAGSAAAIVCEPTLAASLRKSWFRVIGTIVGAVAIVVLTACLLFVVSLALWGGACTLVSAPVRGFVAYAAALAGYTAVIIASDQLGSVGGLNGYAFTLAITRVTEIGIGIVSAGIVLAGTDQFLRVALSKRRRSWEIPRSPAGSRISYHTFPHRPPGPQTLCEESSCADKVL